MTAQPAPWLDPAAVLAHVGVSADADQAGAVERARAAAAAYVQRVRPDLAAVFALGDPAAVPGDVVEGAVLLAARWHARRASPAGLASYAEFGPAAVTRLDVDVERLLGVGRYARPVVG